MGLIMDTHAVGPQIFQSLRYLSVLPENNEVITSIYNAIRTTHPILTLP